VERFVEEEAGIFAMRSNDEARHAYSLLVDSFPTLGNQGSDESWNPREEVEKRRRQHDHLPYCLFLAYFANSYFGIRQAIEIDSIRMGISRLSDRDSQTWALGALIAAVSDLNTGFGGHFAQPRSHPRDLSHQQLVDVLSRRRLSIADEFDSRLRRLGRESESRIREINLVPGPWQSALDAFEVDAAGRPGLVYFDPPYRREEYSRYYHALETLVSYGYPSASGSGLTPDKKRGERFSSEFFSRSAATLVDVLSGIIREIVARGWTCCWSYSDQAAVPPAEVLETLSRDSDLEISSFGAPYQHRGHGRSAQLRPVIEYLIVIRSRRV
jgi:hypothetical protein